MENEGGGGGIVVLLLLLAFMIFMVASFWKVFTKAGQPGWASLVPFYNMYVYLTIAGKPGWWLVMLLIPVVYVVFAILALIARAQRFGKSGGFVAGLIFLPFIFYPILGFGDSVYKAQ